MTLLSILFGFLSSNLPALLKFFMVKQDNAHELAMLQLQMQYNKENLDTRIEEIKISTELAGLSLRQLTTNIGNIYIDGINALVKPFLAVGLFLLYCIINYTYYEMLSGHVTPGEFADLMWTQSDYNFLGAIFGYYFGSMHADKYIK